MDKISKEIDNITEQLKSLKDYIPVVLGESYTNGEKHGIEKTSGLDSVKFPQQLSEQETEIIRDFMTYCYVHGIDFSYMAKATDKIPFCERVLNNYAKCREEGRKW